MKFNKKIFIFIFIFIFGHLNAFNVSKTIDKSIYAYTKHLLYASAIHEAAHIIIAKNLGNKVNNVSVVKKNVNGVVWDGFADTNFSTFKKEIEVLLAGYMAESILLKKEYNFLNNNNLDNIIKEYINNSDHDFSKAIKYIILDNNLINNKSQNWVQELKNNLNLVLPKIKAIYLENLALTKNLILENQEIIKKLAEKLLHVKEFNEQELSAFFDSIKVN